MELGGGGWQKVTRCLESVTSGPCSSGLSPPSLTAMPTSRPSLIPTGVGGSQGEGNSEAHQLVEAGKVFGLK